MHRISVAFFGLVCLLSSLLSTFVSSPLSAQVLPPPEPKIALVPSMVDSLARDNDGDGQISCGDEVSYLVDFGPTSTSEDLDFRDVRLEIPVPTQVATVVPGSLVAFNPDDNPQAASTADQISVFLGRVCKTPTCDSPPARVSFRVQLVDPNSFTSLALQGEVTGSNFPASVTDDPDTSDPVDATVTTYPSCVPQPSISSDLRDELLLDADGDGLADAGDVLRFTHVVVNSTLADADALNLSYRLPTLDGLEIIPSSVNLSLGNLTSVTASDVRVSIPSLAPGSHSSLAFEARIVAPPSLLTTEAQFRATGSNFPIFLSDDPDTTSIFGDPTRTPIDRDPDLAIGLTVSPTVARPGNDLAYTAAASNLGAPTARGTVVSFTVPPSTQALPDSSDPMTCAPDTGAGSTCQLPVGNVAGGSSVTRSFTLAIDAGVPATFTGVTTTASVTDDGSEGPDMDPTNNTDTAQAVTDQVTLGPDLSIDKDDAGAIATPGEAIVYGLHWGNLGNQEALRVEITDTIPDHATFDPGSSDPGWSCTPDASSGSTCRIAIGDVFVGDTGTVRFAVRVDSQIPAGVTALTNTATIAHDGTANDDLDPTDDSDTEVTPLADSVGPDLRLTKTAQTPTAVPGETITYEIVVEDVGTRGATGVRVVEAIPLHTTFEPAGSDTRWSCSSDSCALNLASLSAGGQESLRFVVRVDSTLPAGVTSIANSAVVQDDGTNGDDLDPTDNEDSEDVPVDPTAAPDLGVLKTAQVASVSPGELVAFEITVTNSGNRAATGVTLTETVPSHTTFDAAGSAPGWDCADEAPAGTVCTLTILKLAAGEARVLPFAVRVSQALPAGATVVSNTVQVGDDNTNGDDPNPDDDTDTEEIPLDAAPDVSVEKTAQSLTVRPGDLLTYQIRYGNEGTREATQVRLLETVPDHTSFVAMESDSGWSCAGTSSGSPCELLVGNLPAGSAGTAVFAVRVDSELPAGVSGLTNSVVINHDPDDGDDPDPDDDDDTEDTPIDPSAGPDLGVTKTDLGAIARPSDTVTYAIQVANRGSRGASGVVVTETLPEHTTLVDPAEAPENAPWQCSGGTCTWTLGQLPVGSAETLEITVRVASSVPDGVTAVLNTARVTDDGTNGNDPDLSNNQAIESTPLETTPGGPNDGPDLEVAKSDAGQVGRPGQEIVYQVTVRNSGTQPASGIVVQETVPDGTVFLSSISSPGWSCSDGAPGGTPCRLEISGLAPGDVQGHRFAVRLPAETGRSQVSNTVSVTDDGTNGPDLDPTNNTDSETTPVRRPDQTRAIRATLDDLLTTDGDGDDRADVDDALTYVTRVTNRGSAPETDVRFKVVPDPHTQLLGGSVVVDVPSEIVQGSEFRDAHVEVLIDRLEPGETAEVVFLTQVVALPTAVRHLSVQGEVTMEGLGILTDDPMTSAPDDPTRTPTDADGFEPVDIPTLGQWALLLLAMMLGTAAVFFLRA